MLGVIDVDTRKAHQQVSAKGQQGIPGYSATKVWENIQEASRDLVNQKIDLAILGIPPHYRGSTIQGADLDLILIGIALAYSPGTRYTDTC